MNKEVIFLFVFVALMGMKSVSAQNEYSVDKYNQTMVDTSINQQIMIGRYSYNGVMESAIFAPYIKEEVTEYKPNIDFILTHKDSLLKTSITIIFGSWCSDSQREVPRLLMLLKSAGYPMDSLTIIAVNRQKLVPRIDMGNYAVKYVPTFIFYKHNVEIGRIVENPIESLEADIVSFLFIKI